MNRKGPLAVLGATGNQGVSVIEHVLRRHPDISIRGLTGNLSSTASQNLKEKGVEMVTADVNDESSLVRAFQGATTIFALTDYWTPVFTRIAAGKVDNLWSETVDEEVATGKRIVDAARKTMSTLERFIFSSLPTGMANVPGKHFQGIPWATGKVRIVDYINTCPPEENGKSLSDVTQLIWPGFFMENLSGLNYNYIIPKKDESGIFVMRTPANPDRPIHFLSARADIGLYVAAILAQAPPSASKTTKPVYMYSEALTFTQVVEILQKVTGHRIRYEQMPAGELERQEPVIGEEFQKMYDALNAYGTKGGADVVEPEQLGIDISKATSFEEFVRTHDWEGFFPN